MRTIINILRMAVTVFTLAWISPALAGSCYRADSVKGEIEGLNQDASLTYVTSGRPNKMDQLILKSKKRPYAEMVTDLDCTAKLALCRIDDGAPLQFVYDGEQLKIETSGPIALKFDEAKQPYLTVRSENRHRVIDNMKVLYGPECSQLLAKLPFIQVFPGEKDSPGTNDNTEPSHALPEIRGLR